MSRPSFSVSANNWTWFYSRLLINPNGISCKKGENHISIYLELKETSTLLAWWEINVIFNYLKYNQLQYKYGSLQCKVCFKINYKVHMRICCFVVPHILSWFDGVNHMARMTIKRLPKFRTLLYFIVIDGRVRRFHAVKSKWGITKFIQLKAFHNPLKGYLLWCWGFCCQNYFKEPATCYHLWKITRFSTLLMCEQYGDCNWYKLSSDTQCLLYLFAINHCLRWLIYIFSCLGSRYCKDSNSHLCKFIIVFFFFPSCRWTCVFSSSGLGCHKVHIIASTPGSKTGFLGRQHLHHLSRNYVWSHQK